jgi:hypothetical protein
MPAEGGCGDTRPDVAVRSFTQCRENFPDEGRLPLLGNPGLEMVGGHHSGEAFGLGIGGERHSLGRMELFKHGGIADSQFADHSKSPSIIICSGDQGKQLGTSFIDMHEC